MTTTSPTLLVAGGRGFIGRYVCAAARDAGYRITTLGRSADNDIVRDLRAARRVACRAARRFDYAINLAAYSDHAATDGMTVEQVRSDSGSIVRHLAEYGPFTRALHVSTSEVFGDRRGHPLGRARVDDPFAPQSAYAEGKVEQETWADICGFHTIRVTNVWGEGQPLTKAYPCIKRAISHGEPLTDRTGGVPVQWSHVEAVARGLVGMLTNPALHRHEHLAPPTDYTFVEFVEDTARTLGEPVPPITRAEPLAAVLGIEPTFELRATGAVAA